MDFLDWSSVPDYEFAKDLAPLVGLDSLSSDLVLTEQSSISLLDWEPGDQPRTKKKLVWSEKDDELLRRHYIEQSGKGWEFLCTFFPHHSKTEVKKQVRALRKAYKAKRLLPLLATVNAAPMTRNLTATAVPNTANCLQALKDRVCKMEQELLSSCSKIKELVKQND